METRSMVKSRVYGAGCREDWHYYVGGIRYLDGKFGWIRDHKEWGALYRGTVSNGWSCDEVYSRSNFGPFYGFESWIIDVIEKGK